MPVVSQKLISLFLGKKCDIKTMETLEILGYKFTGICQAGKESTIVIENPKIGFDCGRFRNESLHNNITFISHGHLDHIGGIVHHSAEWGLQKNKNNESIPVYVVPKVILPDVEEYFEVARKLNQSRLDCKILGVDPEETIKISKDHYVKSFKTYHKVPSCGFLLINTRNKLKKEYLGLEGLEIKKIKDLGVEITEIKESLEIAYTGDTTIEVLKNPEVLKAKILFIECTILDKTLSVEDTQKRGHIHLDEIIENADKFENQTIVLMHFSTRYLKNEIKNILDQKLPDSLKKRVIPLLGGFN